MTLWNIILTEAPSTICVPWYPKVWSSVVTPAPAGVGATVARWVMFSPPIDAVMVVPVSYWKNPLNSRYALTTAAVWLCSR